MPASLPCLAPQPHASACCPFSLLHLTPIGTAARLNASRSPCAYTLLQDHIIWPHHSTNTDQDTLVQATYMKIVQPPRAEQHLPAATLRAASTAPGRLHQKPPRSRERFLHLQSPLILLSSHFCFLQWNRNSEVKYQHHMTWFEVSSYPDLFKKNKQIVAMPNKAKGEAGLWEVLNLNSNEQKAQKSWDNFLHKLSSQVHTTENSS